MNCVNYELYILLIISILPVYLVGLYIYKKDKNKEPKKLLKKLFILGMVSCVPAAFVEILLGKPFGSEELMSTWTLFIYVLLTIAFVEELFKWLIVYLLSYNHDAFDEQYDVIVYAVFVSLGFACFENIFYVLDSGISVALLRAFTAIPGHAADAVLMGYYFGLAKLAGINNNKKLCRKNLFLSIIVPTVVHAIYDFCLFSRLTIFLIFFAIFLISVYIYCIKKIKRVANNTTNLYHNDIIVLNNNSYCPKCGSPYDGNYCAYCGAKLK